MAVRFENLLHSRMCSSERSRNSKSTLLLSVHDLRVPSGLHYFTGICFVVVALGDHIVVGVLTDGPCPSVQKLWKDIAPKEQ